MRCAECGNAEEVDALFCGACGSQLGGVAPGATGGVPEASGSQDGGRRLKTLLWVVAALSMGLAVGGLVLLTSGDRDQGGSASPEGDEHTTTDRTDEANGGTSVVGTSTTRPVGSAEVFADAVDAWPEKLESMGGGRTSTEVDLVLGVPTAAVIDGTASPVSVWQYGTATGWTEAGSVAVDWGSGGGAADEFRLVDVTDDDSAELFVQYFPGNDSIGIFFQQRPDGSWAVLLQERALNVDSSGAIRSYLETCVPDCASGPQIEVRHTWNGADFDAQMFDDFGNAVEVYVSGKCPTPYNERLYPPLRRCDKGDRVLLLQQALSYFGFLVSYGGSTPAVDGYFGSDTDTALRLYQLYIDVPVTGVADQELYENLTLAYYQAAFPD